VGLAAGGHKGQPAKTARFIMDGHHVPVAVVSQQPSTMHNVLPPSLIASITLRLQVCRSPSSHGSGSLYTRRHRYRLHRGSLALPLLPRTKFPNDRAPQHDDIADVIKSRSWAHKAAHANIEHGVCMVDPSLGVPSTPPTRPGCRHIRYRTTPPESLQ
jgi:hypothetical protein